MTIDYMLILAIPTLVGLYVLGKTIWVSKHPPQVEVIKQRFYVCPFCGRTFMEQLSARGCSCRTDPMSGDDNPYGMTHQRQEPEATPPQVIVSEGPISNEMMKALRDSLRVVNEPEPICTVDNRRLELS